MRVRLLLLGLLLGLLLVGPSAVWATPCSPTNYTKITNAGPLPADFCAFTYLPWRVKLPEPATKIDTVYSPILQQQYLPNSGLGNGTVAINAGRNIMYTINVDTRGKPPDVGNGAHPVYVASATDPLVHIDCTGSAYGCGNLSNPPQALGPHDIPDIHIPAYARPTYRYGNAYGDTFMTVIQPSGDYFEMYACHKNDADWVNGETLSSSTCGLAGASYGNLVTSAGSNIGNINAGDAQIALPVHWNEVQPGQEINHALHVYAGCFLGGLGRYPGTYAGDCYASGGSGTGVPVGSHIWLDLTREQINATSTAIIPAHMRVFAYALHEHGAFMLDTGDGNKWITQFTLEDALPCFTSGNCTQSFWYPWFAANGGDQWGVFSDGNLKIATPIDWSALASHVWVLDPCYVRGSCSDSVSDPNAQACSGVCGSSNCPACTGAPPPPPLAQWPLNEGSGTVTHTSTAPDMPLTLSGPGTLWGAGHTGTSLQCQDQGAATLTPFTPTGPYSWAFWFEPLLAPNNAYVQQPLNAADSWGFSWGHVSAAFRMEAFHRVDASTYVGVTLTPTPPLGQWSYLTGTWNGATLIVYLNGVFAGQVAAPSLFAATGDMSVCLASFVGTSTGTPYARIDDLTLWNTALTPDQVLGAYQGQTPTQAPWHVRRHATSLGLK